MTREDNIYGVFGEGEETDTQAAKGRKRRQRQGMDFTQPVSFVSSGFVRQFRLSGIADSVSRSKSQKRQFRDLTELRSHFLKRGSIIQNRLLGQVCMMLETERRHCHCRSVKS